VASETYILDVLIQLGIFPEHVGFELGQTGVIFVRVDREYLAAGDRCRRTGSHIVPYLASESDSSGTSLSFVRHDYKRAARPATRTTGPGSDIVRIAPLQGRGDVSRLPSWT